MSIYAAIISSPIGKLGICLTDYNLSQINFLPANTALLTAKSPSAKQIVAELKHYFADPHHIFNLPLLLLGTHLQKATWQEMMQIPVGQTKAYGEIAKKVHSGARAVGSACRRNPLPIIVPCHRVVAAKHLGGYGGVKDGGDFMQIKKWLLKHEAAL